MPALHAYLESKYKIKLTGVTGNNKLTGWTADELAKLDTGEIVYPSYIKTRKKIAPSETASANRSRMTSG